MQILIITLLGRTVSKYEVILKNTFLLEPFPQSSIPNNKSVSILLYK